MSMLVKQQFTGCNIRGYVGETYGARQVSLNSFARATSRRKPFQYRGVLSPKVHYRRPWLLSVLTAILSRRLLRTSRKVCITGIILNLHPEDTILPRFCGRRWLRPKNHSTSRLGNQILTHRGSLSHEQSIVTLQFNPFTLGFVVSDRYEQWIFLFFQVQYKILEMNFDVKQCNVSRLSHLLISLSLKCC